MNPDSNKEFDQNMNQLVWLLKKIIKGLPQHGPMSQLPPQGKEGAININLCFFTFLPMAPEEFDELEEVYEQFLFHEEKPEDLTMDITPTDMDFLRRNGISY